MAIEDRTAGPAVHGDEGHVFISHHSSQVEAVSRVKARDSSHWIAGKCPAENR